MPSQRNLNLVLFTTDNVQTSSDTFPPPSRNILCCFFFFSKAKGEPSDASTLSQHRVLVVLETVLVASVRENKHRELIRRPARWRGGGGAQGVNRNEENEKKKSFSSGGLRGALGRFASPGRRTGRPDVGSVTPLFVFVAAVSVFFVSTAPHIGQSVSEG